VDRIPDDTDCIYFGAWVRLEDQGGDEFIYRIIGANEIDLKLGWISVNSPMARSLLKKRKGDSVIVSRPIGDAEMTIVDVRYEPILV